MDWKEQNNALKKGFDFFDFKQALAFVNAVAAEAERLQHHPDIRISYTHVEFDLITHDQNNVTEKDRKLADVIDSVYATFHAT